MNSRAIGALAAVLALSGCISLGGKVPAQLLNLTPAASAAAGSGASGTSESALAVVDIQAPQKLDVLRVPVTTGGASLAYLKDAQWVEKPARLFGRLLSDTIRAKGNRLVVSGSDAEAVAATQLSGSFNLRWIRTASSAGNAPTKNIHRQLWPVLNVPLASSCPNNMPMPAAVTFPIAESACSRLSA